MSAIIIDGFLLKKKKDDKRSFLVGSGFQRQPCCCRVLRAPLLTGACSCGSPLFAQTSKYQRRYFELTSDTLLYAKDPKDLKDLKDGSGDIEVFAIHELKYIKKLEDEKLEVRASARPHGRAAAFGRTGT